MVEWMGLTVSLFKSNETAISTLLGLLGLDVSSITGQVGLQCSGISAVGLGGNSACSAQPVCCQNNNVVSHWPFIERWDSH